MQKNKAALPTVVVKSADEGISEQAIRDACLTACKPFLYRVGSGILIVRQQDDGTAKRTILTPQAALNLIRDTARIVKSNRDGALTDAPVPEWLGQSLCNLVDDVQDLPPIATFTSAPVIHEDSSISTTAGYDAETQSYYTPAAGAPLRLEVPATPTARDVADAVRTLRALFSGFPFISEADFANTIGTLLALLIRPRLGAATPMVIIGAVSGAGTGKTLLAETLTTWAEGKKTPSSQFSDVAEFNKQVATWLYTRPNILFFDNARGNLHGSTLESLLTTGAASIRVLGHNQRIEGELATTWLVTDNGLTLNPDMARRTYPIRMDAGTATPTARTGFAYDLQNDALAYRAKVLSACYTLIRAWQQAGKPLGPTHTILSASYPRFVQELGSILNNAGITGFLSNVTPDLVARNGGEGEQWEGFLRALFDAAPSSDANALNSAWFTVTGVLARMTNDPEMPVPDDLAHALDKGHTDRAKTCSLGRFFASRAGRRYGTAGYRLQRFEGKTSNTQWRICRDTATGEATNDAGNL